ncbi:hypothetical protein C9J85_16550 [Haloferax sp. wsp5]|nr:hypothetical protein C9J85_16550 [Haloferax sp. wsp5]
MALTPSETRCHHPRVISTDEPLADGDLDIRKSTRRVPPVRRPSDICRRRCASPRDRLSGCRPRGQTSNRRRLTQTRHRQRPIYEEEQELATVYQDIATENGSQEPRVAFSPQTAREKTETVGDRRESLVVAGLRLPGDARDAHRRFEAYHN